MSGYITIDGNTYNVPIISFKRTINTLDRFAERTMDGILHRELIGVFYNYTVIWAKPHNLSAVSNYAALWNALSQATEWHTVAFPDGWSDIYYIGDGANDDIRKIWDATIWWENLTASFIEQGPAAIP